MANKRLTVIAAIMAAGSSSRFGSTKQIAEVSGAPLVRRAVAAARQVCGKEVLTVIGHDLEKVLAALGDDSGFVVVNDNYEQGLGSSIARAARACPDTVDAILVLLADQPLVTAGHLQALVDNWSGNDDEIMATAYSEISGPPVLFPRDTFQSLQLLTGDEGARSLLTDERFRLRTVSFEPAAIDIDTPADLVALS